MSKEGSSIGKTIGKIGGAATGLGTIIIAITAGWNSIKEFIINEPQDTTNAKQQTELVISTNDLEKQALTGDSVQSSTPKNKVENRTPKATPQNAPNYSSNNSNTGNTVVAAASPQSNQKTTSSATTSDKKDMRVSDISFVSLGVFSKDIEIKGVITNRSATTSYRNVAFKIEYFDVNNVLLDATHIHNFDEVFSPNTKKNFSFKAPKVKDTETIKLRCISANAVK